MADEITIPLDDESELADTLVEAFEDGSLLVVLKQCSEQTEAFDFVAHLLQEDWLCIAQSAAEKEDLAGTLGNLIDWYKDVSPDSPVLWYWRMIHAWMTENYEQFIELDSQRDTVPPILFARYYPDEISDYRIRCLLRLGRIDHALEEAGQRGNHSDWYLMTIYAVVGQPEKVFPLLDRYLAQEGYSVYDEWIRGNPDLWKALQCPEYSEWLDSAIERAGMTYNDWKEKQDEEGLREAEEITGLDLRS